MKAVSFGDAISHAEKWVWCLEKLTQTKEMEKRLIDARKTLGFYYVQGFCFFEAKTAIDPIVELAVKHLLELMSSSLANGERIEIRGFGSFSLHYRPPRMGRNPKTGDAVALSGKHVPHFKPGKELRERVNSGRDLPIKS